MRSSVTAVLVASRGGEWLDETIAGVKAQTRRPNAIIAVNNGGSERVSSQLVEGSYGSDADGSARVIGIQSKVSFGRAIDAAISTVALGEHPEQEWIWL